MTRQLTGADGPNQEPQRDMKAPDWLTVVRNQAKAWIFAVPHLLFLAGYLLVADAQSPALANMLVIFPPALVALALGVRMGVISLGVSLVMSAGLNWYNDTLYLLADASAIIGLFALLGIVLTMGRLQDMSRALEKEAAARRMTQRDLKDSERKYRTVLEHASDGIGIVTRGALQYLNPRLAEMLGYEPSELEGARFLELVAPGHRAGILDRLSFPEVTVGVDPIVEVEMLGRDETVVATEMALGPVQLGEEQSLMIVVRDISERVRVQQEKKRFEEQLRQSEKIESLGRLAGGVAHDINNILTAIIGSAGVLKQETHDPLNRLDLENILTAANRGNALTKDLLRFARKGRHTKHIVSLNDIVHTTLCSLIHTVPGTVDVVSALDLSVSNIEGDPNQLGHATMNILLNALDALHHRKGMIRIRTENLTLGLSVDQTAETLPPGRYTAVEISDTGRGMSKDTLSQVFEPFFTTKPRGEGDGLGLSMVYGTVKNHGGTISISSTEGQGTIVTMIFPVTEDTEATAISPIGLIAGTEDDTAVTRLAAQERPSLKPGGGCILLVDDEAPVRKATKRFLSRIGYEVLLAENGKDALEIYQRDKEKIQVVLLDMVMPQMDGFETFTRMQSDLQAEVILLSGYCADSTIDQMLKKGAFSFLQKPVDFDVLSYEIYKAKEYRESKRREIN